ncbi:MAG: FIST C-terminal domain-containing protein [Pirellulaceae bacterium]
MFESLPNREQSDGAESLHLGRVVSEYQDAFGQGDDFLVRNVMGVDQQSGAIVVGDYMRPGQTVQFHVRDAETADDEMRQLLAQLKSQPDIALPPVRYCSRATVAARGCFETTAMLSLCEMRLASCRSPASLPRANLAPSVARTSCTALPPASLSSNSRGARAF